MPKPRAKAVFIADRPVIYNVSSLWRADTILKNGSKTKRRAKLQANLKRHQAKNRKYNFSSLSHTLNVGGWVLSAARVGIDLEPRDRDVSDKALKWYARPGEIELVRSALKLWVMKESAFKALRGPKQPLTLRHLRITDCRVVEARQKPSSQNEKMQFFFELKKAKKIIAHGEGLLISSARTIMGISVVISY